MMAIRRRISFPCMWIINVFKVILWLGNSGQPSSWKKNTSSYYVKTLLLDAGFNMPHSHWETARFWILQMWGNWQSVFFSRLKKPLVCQFHWSCTLLHTLKKKKKRRNLSISLQLIIRKLTVYSGNCFPKFCFFPIWRLLTRNSLTSKQGLSNT